ncbi:MAG: PadR family transcriptional regulator [Clostridium sp.]|uniref:PadR family transcriptional regulator n=1 Tax=Clostridium TaxID=1485 RepID=UPI002152B8D7|nr:PadR family transcriptional regulator [Clostridium sp. LY3-2]MCR6514937.1 PadR family transcriptional regulator [Clostridium sp. LY3-2]
MNKELLKGSTSLLILGLLNKEEMYGYQMIKSIEITSDGIFSFKEGTLYPILHTLENEGIIESYWKESETNRKRKYYSITKEGKKYLKTKEKEWSLFSKTVNKVLGGTS